jgi:nucleoside phosphorylase
MICVQICSELEWQAVKDILNPQNEDTNNYPYGEYFGQAIGHKQIIIFNSGDTKTKSAAACQYAIDHWNPKIIIVLGTCGGVDERLKLLDVVSADKTAQYDCIIRMAGENNYFYPTFDVDIDNIWIDYSLFPEKIHSGLIATADQDIDYAKRKELIKHNVLAADWESGAISYVCKMNKIKCCIIRGVTDVPTGNDKKQGTDYKYNTPLIMKKLINDILPCLLKQITNNKNEPSN